jgi:ubiquinone/menaquinone biosynthesis C-methylase UbiE
MNTNYIDFINEANRVLRVNGHLIIAEVLSRMPRPSLFVRMIKSFGFKFIKYVSRLFYLSE